MASCPHGNGKKGEGGAAAFSHDLAYVAFWAGKEGHTGEEIESRDEEVGSRASSQSIVEH